MVHLIVPKQMRCASTAPTPLLGASCPRAAFTDQTIVPLCLCAIQFSLKRQQMEYAVSQSHPFFVKTIAVLSRHWCWQGTPEDLVVLYGSQQERVDETDLFICRPLPDDALGLFRKLQHQMPTLNLFHREVKRCAGGGEEGITRLRDTYLRQDIDSTRKVCALHVAALALILGRRTAD